MSLLKNWTMCAFLVVCVCVVAGSECSLLKNGQSQDVSNQLQRPLRGTFVNEEIVCSNVGNWKNYADDDDRISPCAASKIKKVVVKDCAYNYKNKMECDWKEQDSVGIKNFDVKISNSEVKCFENGKCVFYYEASYKTDFASPPSLIQFVMTLLILAFLIFLLGFETFVEIFLFVPFLIMTMSHFQLLGDNNYEGTCTWSYNDD